MNQMRELFEKWAKSECLDTDSVDGFYSDNDTHIAWGSWQAAQSVSVPVVGDVVAWVNPDDKGLLSSVGRVGWYELIEKPATSIRADELDALRKDAERLDSGMIITSERDEFGEDYSCHRRGINLREAIDAAIAGETEHG